MTKPVVTATTLVTEDGVPIDAIHLPGTGDLAIVVAHGFTLSWQRPSVWRIANRFNQTAGVFTFDFRGHGRSGGLSTLGDREISDLDVVVAWARQLGYKRVAAVGFSMGASIVLRHAGLVGGLDAVVSVSGPGRWYYKGTEPMRRVHFAVEHRIGRFVTRRWLKTRISPQGWKLVPVPPAEAAAQISPVPLLIVHGDKDHYFPPEHARQLYVAAREPKELWLIPGMGHAESACGQALVDRIGRWVDQATARPGRSASARTRLPRRRPRMPAAARQSGPAGLGVDHDRDRVHVIAGFIEVLVRRGRVERDRVARAELVALEAHVGLQGAADDQEVLAPVVAQRPALVGGVATGGVDHLQEVGHGLGLRGEPLPAHAAGQVDDLAAVAALHDRGRRSRLAAPLPPLASALPCVALGPRSGFGLGVGARAVIPASFWPGADPNSR